MADPFKDFVDNIVTILELKTSDWDDAEVLNFGTTRFNKLPAITVDFTDADLVRLNRDEVRIFAKADIWYYQGEWTEDLQKEKIIQRLWEIVHWLLTHQTTNSFTLDNWVPNVGFFVRPTEQYMIAGGLIKFAATIDKVDITDVS